jgi:hypothetical protein
MRTWTDDDLDGLAERLAVMIFPLMAKLAEEAIGARKDSVGVAPLGEAWQLLGYRSRTSCWRKIDEGYYREGKEAFNRASPDAEKATWYLDIEACRRRDKELARKRR